MSENKANYDRTHLASAPTVDDGGRRRWIYPDRRSGEKADFRKRLAFVLITFYVLAPWLRFNDLPLIRIDVRETSFYFFGIGLNFADASYLFFLFVIALVSLFLITAMKGRIWCGYACPQTVFVEWVIRPIEEWIEGPAHSRRIQDKKKWTVNLKFRKLLKHVLFLMVSVIVANTFLAYFYPAEEVLSWMQQSPFEHSDQFLFMSFIAALFYFDLTWFREQFCSFLCPYARFQAVMVDNDTPTVAYDYTRGEPRGKRGVKGDCIDCGLCVRVCPTGIDIRNGLQLECIQCLRCVDACDGIMTSLKRPKGLVRQASMAEIEGSKPRFFRPRFFLYLCVLAALLAGFFYRFTSRSDFAMSFVRQPGTAYTMLDDGQQANMFTARLSNQSQSELKLKFEVLSPEGGKVVCAGCDQTLPPMSKRNQPLLLVVPADFMGDRFVLQESTTGQEFEVPLILPSRVK